MNAVEAVEQLGAIGRKLQAREAGLQQPSLRLQMALRQSAEWEKVLGDPVAALSRLLGAAGGGQVRTKEAADGHEATELSSPLAPFRWEEDRPPTGSGSPAARGGFGGGQSGEPGSGSRPAGGMRLARRQTSLLGILNANLEDRPYPGMGEQGRGAALTSDVRPERRPAVQDENAVDLSRPVVNWSAAPSSFVPQDEMGQSSGQAPHSSGGSQQDKPDYRDGSVASLTGVASLTSAASLTVQSMESDWQGGESGAAADAGGANVSGEGNVEAGMGVWAYESRPQHGQAGAVQPNQRQGHGERLEPARGTASDPDRDMPAARHEEPNPALAPAPGALQSHTRPERQAGDWSGWLQNADLAPVQDGVWAAANERQEERPLSMAQIEQVLSALDDRLELMLLRMYGSPGGLP